MKGWNFCSDNVAGAAPEILQALINAGAAGAMMPYGADPLTSKVEKRLAEIFETDLAVHFVATGTAAKNERQNPSMVRLNQFMPPWSRRMRRQTP